MADEECGVIDFVCKGRQGISDLMQGTLSDIVNSILEAVGNAIVAVGTIWVRIPTPDLTGGGSGSTPVEGWAAPDGSGEIETVLSYGAWIALGVCVLSVIALGVRLAHVRTGDGAEQMGRLGMVLGAVVLISGAAAIVTALMPTPGSRPGPAASAPVGMIQDSLWWYTAAVAVLSIIIGGARMAWEQRAQPGKDVLRSLLTLVVVSGAGLSIVASLVVAADAFSGWMLNQATACDVTDPTTGCFAKSVTTMFAPLSAAGLGQILVIVLGLLALIGTMIQIVLMLARAGMLVILTGILPLSAAATNTETGKQWFRKNVAWLAGFILYKPAAAIVYAAAIKLMASDWVTGDNPIVAMLAGLTLMGISLVALPALMRFITPLVAVTAGGAGGAAMAAGMAAMALPTGAVQLAQRGGDQASPQGAAPAGGGGAGSSGPSGSHGGSGGSGSNGAAGSSGSNGSAGAGKTGPQGAPAGGGGGGAAVTTGGAAASGGGTAAAGAAGGPVGMAAAAGVQTVQKVAGTAKAVANDAAASTGEGGGGPRGSN